MISDAAKKVMVEAHVLRYWEEELGLPIKRNELGHRYYTEEDVRRFMEIKELKERGLQLKAIRMVLKNGKLDMLPKEMEEELSLQGETAAALSAPEERGTVENKIVDIPLKAEKDKPEMTEQELLKEEAKEDTSVNANIMEKVSEAIKDTEKVSEKKKPDAPKAEKKKKKKTAPTIAERQKAELQQEKLQKKKQQEKELQEEAPSYELMESHSDTLKVETKEDKSARLQWLLQQLFRQTLQENNEYLCREIKESLLKELDYQFRMQEEKQEERDAERLRQEEEHYKKIDELLRKKRRLLKR